MQCRKACRRASHGGKLKRMGDLRGIKKKSLITIAKGTGPVQMAGFPTRDSSDANHWVIDVTLGRSNGRVISKSRFRSAGLTCFFRHPADSLEKTSNDNQCYPSSVFRSAGPWGKLLPCTRERRCCDMDQLIAQPLDDPGQNAAPCAR